MLGTPVYITLNPMILTRLEGMLASKESQMIVLAAPVAMLGVATLVVDEFAKSIREKYASCVDLADQDIRPIGLESLPAGSPVIFRELRGQDLPMHSAKLASELWDARGTVVAIVHGQNLSSVQRRLIDLGMSESLVKSEDLAVEYLSEDMPHMRTTFDPRK
jgi:hypothetical protein